MLMTQQIQQELQSLPQAKIQEVLDFVRFLKRQPDAPNIPKDVSCASPSATMLMQLSPQARRKSITQQFHEAERLYADNPDLIFPDVDDVPETL